MAHSRIPKLLDEVFSLRTRWPEQIREIVPIFCNDCIIYFGKIGYEVHRHVAELGCTLSGTAIMFVSVVQRPRFKLLPMLF
jgi:hypothetical protein